MPPKLPVSTHAESSLRPVAFGLLAILCWSLTATLATYVGQISNIPFVVALTQFTGMTVLGLLQIFLKVKSKVKSRNQHLQRGVRDPRFAYLWAYSALFIGYQYALYFSINTTDPFSANSINYLWPLFLPIFIRFTRAKRDGRSSVSSIASSFERPSSLVILLVAFCATLVIFYGGRSNSHRLPENTLGMSVAFAAAILAPSYMTLGTFLLEKRSLDVMDYVVFFRRIYTFGFLISLPIAVLISIITPFSVSQTSILAACLAGFLLGILSLAAANVFWQIGLIESVKINSFVDIPILGFITPVASAVALLLFSRTPIAPSWGVYLGAIVIFSLIVITFERSTRMSAGTWGFFAFFGLALLSFSLKNFVIPVYPAQIKEIQGALPDQAFLGLITLFSILAAFFLQRSWDKAKEESSLALKISRLSRNLYQTSIHFNAEDAFYVGRCIRKFLEIFYFYLCARKRNETFERGELVKGELKKVGDILIGLTDLSISSSKSLLKTNDKIALEIEECLSEVSKELSLLSVRRSDGFTHGQTTILSGVGGVCIAYLILQFSSNIISIFINVLACAGIVYIIALVRDLASRSCFSSTESVFLISSVFTDLYKTILVPNRSFPWSSYIAKSTPPYQLQYIEVSADEDRLLGRTEKDLRAATTLQRTIYICLSVMAVLAFLVMYDVSVRG